MFRRLNRLYPQKFAVKIAFDNHLAHQIEAGSDMFLMPSKYEPAGLNQLYSLKYGTVPIVRATGGLDDTVEQWDPQTRKGTGFKFREYNGEALLETASDSPCGVSRSRQVASSHAQRHGAGLPWDVPRRETTFASMREPGRSNRGCSTWQLSMYPR